MDTEAMKPTRANRVLCAVLGGVPGVGLGALCFFVLGYAIGWALFVGALGAFIGAALAQPDVSKANVFTAAAGAIVANNVPVLGDRILGTLDEQPEPPGLCAPPLACTDVAEFPDDAPEAEPQNDQST